MAHASLQDPGTSVTVCQGVGDQPASSYFLLAAANHVPTMLSARMEEELMLLAVSANLVSCRSLDNTNLITWMMVPPMDDIFSLPKKV